MTFNPRHGGQEGSRILGNAWGSFSPPATFRGARRERAARRLADRMVEISGDASGSDPRDYLSAVDFRLLQQFRALALHLNGAGSQPIRLSVPRFSGYPVWKRDRMWNHHALAATGIVSGVEENMFWKGNDDIKVAKAGLTRRFFMRQEGPTHQGYLFGAKLSVGEPAQPVTYCIDDGMFRSLRGSELPVSYGEGWGKLPEADLIQPVIIHGQHHGVHYTNANSTPLSDLLISSIPASARSGVNLAHFGFHS